VGLTAVPVRLIFLNAALRIRPHQAAMTQPSAISERLLAHARLCREIAHASLNEETAAALGRLAVDCIEAAHAADTARQTEVIPRPAGHRQITS
jgi:hypothetical protein